MFFYRYNVSEPHLEKFGCWLGEAFRGGKTQKVKTLAKGIHVHKVKDSEIKQWVYFVYDTAQEGAVTKKADPHVLGFCALNIIPRWKALETGMLYINPDHRRAGYAIKLYDAIFKDGQIVISGYSHNPKSRALWQRISADSRYVTWAQDIIDLTRISPIWFNEDDHLDSDLKLYEDIKKLRKRRKQDIRIVACIPRFVK